MQFFGKFFVRRFFVTLFAIAIMLSASASAQEAIAVITNVDGEVFFKAAMDSSWQVARTKTPLREGDSVKTSRRASATILYKNSLQKTLPGGKKYVVRSSQPSSRSNSWLTNLWSALILQKEDLTPIGASRGENLLKFYPRFRKALSARPTFTWLPVTRGATHHVQIVDENTLEIIWEISTVDTFVTYPPDALSLADSQEYTIQLLRAGESDPDDEMTFTVASIEEREKILFQQKRIKKQYRPRAVADITPRDTLAKLLLKVAEYQPAVIGMDFELHEEESNDSLFQKLERAILATNNLVLPLALQNTARGLITGSSPPPHLQQKVAAGFANFHHTTSYPPVRAIKLITTLADGQTVPSFALAIVGKYLERNAEEMNWQNLLHKVEFSASPEKFFPINYFGPPEVPCADMPCAKIYSFTEILNDNIPQDWLANKIVLLGATFKTADASDTFDTPFGEMRGVGVHANIITNLLTRQYLHPLGDGVKLLVTLLAVAVAMLALWQLRLGYAIAVTFGILLIYVVAAFVLFSTHRFVLPLEWPVKAGVLGFLLFFNIRTQWLKPRQVREYLDFEILLEEAAQPNHFNVRVIAAPPQAGDAKGEMAFDDWPKVPADLKKLQMRATDKAFLKTFGDQLYRHLFAGDINDCYQRSLTQARLEKKGLRIRLRFDAPALRAMPWEFLYDRRNNFFLSTHAEVLLTRYVESQQPRRDLGVEALNMLIVLSDPTPESLLSVGLPVLDISNERKLIIAALQEMHDATSRPIRWTVLEHAVTAEIRQQLRQGVHVFHFIGHSAFRNGKGQIVLENEHHEAQYVDEETFSSFFAGDTNVRLVLLNSCQGASTSALQEISGLAYQLLQKGIPAVAGMQHPINDQTAVLFAGEFYRTLAGGQPVDFAMAQSRLAIAQEIGFDKIDFGTPVLFMRARDGKII